MLDWEEYDRWLRQARRTRELIDAGMEYEGYSQACFKAHQAAEYALKALLHLVGRPAHGRSLTVLHEHTASPCGGGSQDELVECIKMLEKMYIPPRYPDAFPSGAPYEHYTRREAERTRACALMVIERVEKCAESLRRGS